MPPKTGAPATVAPAASSSLLSTFVAKVTAKDALPLLRILILALIYVLGACVFVFSDLSHSSRLLIAFGTRMFSVLRYESVIHEFDPYFNFRSTKYLVDNGFYDFINWFDAESWYPLGRIVGGTVYPGAFLIVFQLLHANISVSQV